MPDLRLIIDIGVPARTVFPLVASGDGFARWWTSDVIITPSGATELGFEGRSRIYRLRAETMMIPAHAAWSVETGEEWAGTSIVFDLSPTDSGARLTMVHGNWRAATDFFHACATTWGMLLYRLKAAAEGGNPGPNFA